MKIVTFQLGVMITPYFTIDCAVCITYFFTVAVKAAHSEFDSRTSTVRHYLPVCTANVLQCTVDLCSSALWSKLCALCVELPFPWCTDLPPEIWKSYRWVLCGFRTHRIFCQNTFIKFRC